MIFLKSTFLPVHAETICTMVVAKRPKGQKAVWVAARGSYVSGAVVQWSGGAVVQPENSSHQPPATSQLWMNEPATD